MEQITPGLAGGASVVLLTVLFGALFRVVQLMLRTQRDCTVECAELRADLQWERQGKDAMIHACQQASVPIPPLVWQPRPQTDASSQGRRRDDA